MIRPADFFKYWLPLLAWMGVIFYFSSRQRVSVSPEYFLNFLFFKTLHVLEYAMMFFLSYRAFGTTTRSDPRLWRYALAYMFVILYAVSDEIHQTFVPTREGRLRDVIIDALGAIIAWLTIERLLPKMPIKLRKLAGALDLT
jgi:VanZ family protein